MRWFLWLWVSVAGIIFFFFWLNSYHQFNWQTTPRAEQRDTNAFGSTSPSASGSTRGRGWCFAAGGALCLGSYSYPSFSLFSNCCITRVFFSLLASCFPSCSYSSHKRSAKVNETVELPQPIQKESARCTQLGFSLSRLEHFHPL